MSLSTTFAHGLVIFVMFSIVLDGYRPKWKDYNAIIWTTVLVLSIIIINLLLGGNYMFTLKNLTSKLHTSNA